MRFFFIEGNSQRLDGGAMYGNAPKAMWEKWSVPDAYNRIKLACRALLVQDKGKNILLEAGIGSFFEPKMRERFGVDGSGHALFKSLSNAGLSHEDIDVVILSHFHFDHVGGLLSSFEDGKCLLFPNAVYLAGRTAWENSRKPHIREKASYIDEIIEKLEQSGRLDLVDKDSALLDSARWSFSFSHGHTPGLMITTVETDQGPLCFSSDLIPGVPWVHLPITMGYDRFPELLIDEKREILDMLCKRNGRLVFTHDPSVGCAGIACENGRYRAVSPVESVQFEM